MSDEESVTNDSDSVSVEANDDNVSEEEDRGTQDKATSGRRDQNPNRKRDYNAAVTNAIKYHAKAADLDPNSHNLCITVSSNGTVKTYASGMFEGWVHQVGDGGMENTIRSLASGARMRNVLEGLGIESFEPFFSAARSVLRWFHTPCHLWRGGGERESLLSPPRQ